MDIRPVGHNLFIIQLPNTKMRDKVLESGPWHIQNRPLIVRRWEAEMKSLEFSMAKLPLWIQLSNIPLELFSQKGISYIASGLGNPLYMDRITTSQQRLAYARVCVEVEASKTIPQSLEIELKNGITVHVHVEIPWQPAKCSQCCIFGHGDKDCPMKSPVQAPEKIWKPKQVDQTHEEGGEGNKKEEIEKGEKEKTEDIQVKAKVVEKGCSSKSPEILVGKNSGSMNKYAILEFVNENIEVEAMAPIGFIEEKTNVEPRKARAASARVADLMKNLKPKKKGPIDKGRNKAKVGSPVL